MSQVNSKKILKIASLGVFFIFIISYAIFRSHDLVFGVKIRNVNIENGLKSENSIIPVIGVAKNSVKLTVNGREISIDQKGNFSDKVALLPGYNIINIKAEDKFGYVDEKNYQLVY